MALRQGLHVVKSRRRDPRAIDFGCYFIANMDNCIVAGTRVTGRADLSLDDVEKYLTGAPLRVKVGILETKQKPLRVKVGILETKQNRGRKPKKGR